MQGMFFFQNFGQSIFFSPKICRFVEPSDGNQEYAKSFFSRFPDVRAAHAYPHPGEAGL